MGTKAHWSESEKSALAAHYPAVSAERLRDLLQSRTEKAIIMQAARMGVSKLPERLREMGSENIRKRWDRRPPVQ